MVFEYLKLIHFYYLVSFGFVPNENFFRYYEDSIYVAIASSDNKYLFTNDVEIEFTSPKEFYYIGGTIQTNFARRNKSHSMFVIQNSYNFSTGLRIDKIEFGYTHYCTHPIAMSLSNKGNKNSVYGAYDKFHISISNKRRE